MNCAWLECDRWYLERQTQLRETPKAGGFGGQILELLRYRGLLDRFEAACTGPVSAAQFPFGGAHLDFTHLADPPMHALPLPQPRLERLLDDRARELGPTYAAATRWSESARTTPP